MQPVPETIGSDRTRHFIEAVSALLTIVWEMHARFNIGVRRVNGLDQ